ncbi:MAG: hypothetical protein AAF270_04150 [Pseudomonadota bacterium]
MKQEETKLDQTAYEWLWTVRSVRTERGECVPMRRGDGLYICVGSTGKVRFHHRGQRSDENTGLWNGAVAEYCKRTNTISGKLPDKRTFSMEIATEDGYHRITCKHKRNPDEGEWDADDVWI